MLDFHIIKRNLYSNGNFSVKRYLKRGDDFLMNMLSSCFTSSNNFIAFCYLMKLSALSGNHHSLLVSFCFTGSRKYVEMALKLNARNKNLMMGLCYYEKGTMQEFVEEFKIAAKNGYIYCAYRLGVYLYKKREYKNAAKYLEMMPIDKFPDAYAFLYVIYCFGPEHERNIDKGLMYLKKGAHSGSSKCLVFLGMAYYGGLNVERDLGQAYINFIFSYKNDYMSAYYLSEMYRNGNYVEKDEEQSIFFSRYHYFGNKDNEDIIYKHANNLYKWGRYDESMNILFEAVRNDHIKK